MAKPVSISFTFQTQSGPIPLSELDTNFASLAQAINDFATYGNYLIDTSGAANVITVNTPGGTTFSYNAGVPIQVQIAHTTTISGVTINVNGLGSKAVVNNDGSVLIVGAFVVGQILEMMYDGTSFRVLPQPGANTVSSFAQLTVGPPASGTALTVIGLGGANTISANGFVVAQAGNVTINAPSSGSALTMTAVGGAASSAMNIWSGAVNDSPYVVLGRNTTAECYIGVSAASSPILTGSTLGDLCLRGNAAGVSIGGGSTLALRVATAGAVTINAPSSGTALTVGTVSGAASPSINIFSGAIADAPYMALGRNSSIDAYIGIQSSGNAIIIGATNGDLVFRGQTAGISMSAGGSTLALRIATTGAVTIAAPTSGNVALTASGVAGSSALQVLVTGAQIGSPAGGDKGLGAINAVAYYTAGVNNIQTGTFTGTITGGTTAPTATFNYTIVNGTHCIIDCSAGLTVPVSNAVTMTITGVAAACTPARTQLIATPVENATAFQNGYVSLSGTTLTFGAGIAAFSGGFTASGVKGIGAGWSMAFNLI
jgi:trimeric autotransporter adhesin